MLHEIVRYDILHVQHVGAGTFVIERLKYLVGLAVRTGWAEIVLQTLVVFPTLFAAPKTLKALIQYIADNIALVMAGVAARIDISIAGDEPL